MINTNSFTGDSLHTAALIAASYATRYDSLGNDYLAMNLLKEILDYEPLHPNEATENIRNIVYHLLEEIYPRALENNANNAPIKEMMLDVITARVEGAGDTLLFNRDFYTYMEAALSSYSAGSLPEAREFIEQARPLSSFLNEEHLQYWDCLIGLNEQLRDSLITPEQIFDLMLACDSPPANARVSSKVDVMEYIRSLDARQQDKQISIAQLVLSPNPATDKVEIAFVAPKSGQGYVSIIDLSGKLVKRTTFGELHKGANRLQLPVNDIASGMYTVQVQGPDFFGVTKLVVTR